MKEPLYRRETAEIVSALISYGIDATELPRLLGVSAERFQKWQKQHRELKDALQTPGVADRAEAALLKRALGFQISEESAEELVDKKSGELLEILKHRTITKEVAPDVRALLFFLKNRYPERWSEKSPSEAYEFVPGEDEANL
ncbi:MAG: hypothetical protein E7047_08590 [Lentisphaerae bacterium]|nr:hypothetical protein [Lentisphaerota bacterium]